MAGFASLVQNAGYAYVPLSPLLNNAFGMLYGIGQQKRAESAAAKAQKRQLIGDAAGAGIGAAATLGAGSMISSAMSPAASTAAATTAKATTGAAEGGPMSLMQGAPGMASTAGAGSFAPPGINPGGMSLGF